ncbi:hypothetical protein GCK32_016580 [Trichostrongylus colubriformis]|uniref:Uncharacterized protein n=1 Tax=Trichostrongylus colubriformis TaxID=6319 RepID=A0AAN8J2X3_TRICO
MMTAAYRGRDCNHCLTWPKSIAISSIGSLHRLSWLIRIYGILLKVSRTVLKRMKILGSKQIMEVELFDTTEPEATLSEGYASLTERILHAIDKNLPGAEVESETESEFSDESTDEEETLRDKKRL